MQKKIINIILTHDFYMHEKVETNEKETMLGENRKPKIERILSFFLSKSNANVL